MPRLTTRREFLKGALQTAAALPLASSFGPASPPRPPCPSGPPARRPNFVFILADDAGYGDYGCFGATRVKTPHIDRLAAQGARFTDAYAPSATCTPTRYSILTGEYAWRRAGTGILPGDAPLIIEPGRPTLPAVLKAAGYATGAVGKWHLGLGRGAVDFNGEIAPGPLDIGFDYFFGMPATGDRVPCVYVENRRVVGLDPKDPIRVSYKAPVGDEPTGKSHPGLLRMKLTAGHDGTIVNGISRIGWMSGGRAARWVDEEMADTYAAKAVAFVERHKDGPFFLYFAPHDPHVPRAPHPRFRGTSGCGVRGDVLQEFDDSVGRIMAALDRLGLAEDTLLVVTSDNGGVVNDGYDDGADRDLAGHSPNGPLRDGKYAAYEGGVRVPFVARWPRRIAPGRVSAEMICLIDMAATAASLSGAPLPAGAAPDSVDVLPAVADGRPSARASVVLDGRAIRRGAWKLVLKTPPKPPAGTSAAVAAAPPAYELYDLAADVGEKTNVADRHPDVVKELAAELQAARRG
jgi:arylsulfatase A-like enzyme